ncbi:MAG: atpF2 [Rickettsiales bacterium]|jgi:F-type H+-transporting ATPase subunit b|nr:atpF2 [Rickettsiales bacterium]
MPQLDPAFFASQLFWLAVMFATLYLYLARIGLPKVRTVLQDRESRIANDLEKASAMRAEAEHAKADYTSGLEGARKSAMERVTHALETIRKETQDRHAQLDQTLARQLVEAELRVTKVKNDAIAELTPVSEELATIMVNKLLAASSAGGSKKNKTAGAA